MAHEALQDIIALCLSVDELASQAYARLSRRAKTKRLQDFWKEMAEDEARHIAFWRQLLQWVEGPHVPLLFNDPDTVKEELADAANQALALVHDAGGLSNIRESLLLAYRLEFYLLHPAFEVLFHFAEEEAHVESPEKHYEKHLGKLAQVFQELKAGNPELEFVSELMMQLLVRNHGLALRETHIRALKKSAV